MAVVRPARAASGAGRAGGARAPAGGGAEDMCLLKGIKRRSRADESLNIPVGLHKQNMRAFNFNERVPL